MKSFPSMTKRGREETGMWGGGNQVSEINKWLYLKELASISE